MRYALNAAQMKQADRNTIEHFGVASLVLQERAALAVCELVSERFPDDPQMKGRAVFVRIYAGYGNNGADAVACARILSQRGFRTETLLVGEEAKQTAECAAQIRSARAYGLNLHAFSSRTSADNGLPDLVIDGLLGVGINRGPDGNFETAILEINRLGQQGVPVFSVDMPSGVGADDGKVFSLAVTADETVTFGFAKTGQLLYPGASHCGRLHVADIGITTDSLLQGTEQAVLPDAFYFDTMSEIPLPERVPCGNKGTFGKVLLVTGSRETGGAAILAARAALRAGCGMVRVFTECANRDAILNTVPEALIDVYDAGAFSKETAAGMLDRAYEWSDAVVCGCGTGTREEAFFLLSRLLEKKEKPLVLDADALNLLSLPGNGLAESLCAGALEAERCPVVFTPHAGEFARLYNRFFDREVSVEDCKENVRNYPAELARETGAIVLYKDAVSVVTGGRGPLYLNVSGNDGMATAGSGDVLAGLLGSLLAQTRGKQAFETVCAGTFYHGLAGDYAAEETGRRALCASDIADTLQTVLSGPEASA